MTIGTEQPILFPEGGGGSVGPAVRLRFGEFGRRGGGKGIGGGNGRRRGCPAGEDGSAPKQRRRQGVRLRAAASRRASQRRLDFGEHVRVGGRAACRSAGFGRVGLRGGCGDDAAQSWLIEAAAARTIKLQGLGTDALRERPSAAASCLLHVERRRLSVFE